MLPAEPETCHSTLLGSGASASPAVCSTVTLRTTADGSWSASASLDDDLHHALLSLHVLHMVHGEHLIMAVRTYTDLAAVFYPGAFFFGGGVPPKLQVPPPQKQR